MAEMLESLDSQIERNFEVVVVEDGSSKPCKDVADRYAGKMEIKYVVKPNTGRSDTRNTGMREAEGNYFLFFDSDCILPPEYMQTLNRCLKEHYVDCFGGPDRALDSFSPVQKAVNFAMTSFLTTGGIRGSGKVCMEKFNPRSFNMGFSREVYEKVGGFADMFGEDIDLTKLSAAYENNYDKLKNTGTRYKYTFVKKGVRYILEEYEVLGGEEE